MRTPYEILGVAPTASEADINKAFRKLAKQCHPDLHPGDKAAEARFRELSNAHDLLADPAKRARFDRGEIDAQGHDTFSQARRGGGHGFGGNTGGSYHFDFGGGPDADIMDELFGRGGFGGFGGRARPRPGADVHAALAVDFTEAALGAVKRILVDGKSLDVTIPPGLKDGQTLRLKGLGQAGANGGSNGAVLVEISVRPHRLFRRDGNDIHLDLPISLPEAVNGGRITVPTLTGAVTMAVPAGSNSGKVLRLKGKGIQGGDQYVTLRISLPEVVDGDLSRLVEEWAQKHPYDPRAGLMD